MHKKLCLCYKSIILTYVLSTLMLSLQNSESEKFRQLAKKGKWKKGRFSSLNRQIPELEGKGHEPSRAELKIIQLEPWLEPARLGLITSN